MLNYIELRITMAIPVVDTHVHLIDPDVNDYNWAHLAPSFVERSWLEQHYLESNIPTDDTMIPLFDIKSGIFIEVDACDSMRELMWAHKVSTENPKSKINGFIPSIPLEQGAVYTKKFIDDISESKVNICGVRRLLQSMEPTEDPVFLKPDFLESLEFLGSKKLPFDICVYHHQFNQINQMVRNTPNTLYVLDHFGKPYAGKEDFEQWSLSIKQFSEFSNTRCKLSPGFLTDSKINYSQYLDYIVTCFGSDRLVVGSDWFFSNSVITPGQWFKQINDFLTMKQFTKKQINDVFCDNALKIYKK